MFYTAFALCALSGLLIKRQKSQKKACLKQQNSDPKKLKDIPKEQARPKLEE